MLKSHLGFQKTTNKVSIGRRLTKSLLKRKIFIVMLQKKSKKVANKIQNCG